MTGTIFNIQRYSLHDGEGIRTMVFFKGCSLKCPWCSNPESINKHTEIMINKNLCIGCIKCSRNETNCPTGAYKISGAKYTVEEIIELIMKDSVFYRSSGGGVTLSGGEVLLQTDFAIALLKKIKSLGIHTAIETSGQGSESNYKRLIKFVDHIMFDVKIADKSKFKATCNGNIELVIKNLRQSISSGKKLTVRVPIIPDFTDNPENIKEIIKLLGIYKVKKIELMPFHQYGREKYNFMEKPYKLKSKPSLTEKDLFKIQNIFQGNNILAKIS